MGQMHYHQVTISTRQPKSCIIKTEAPDLTIRDAVRVYERVHDVEIPPAELEEASISLLINCDPDEDFDPGATDGLVIRDQVPDGIVFYREPGGTADMVLTRLNWNGSKESTFTHMLSVPSFLMNRDCTGWAVRVLLGQIAEDFCRFAEEPRKTFPNGPAAATWDELMNVPADFLARYGVTIEPLDTFLSMAVGMNETIL